MKRCLVALVAGLLLLVTGCGSALTAETGVAETAPPMDTSFNPTDVMFLQMLLPHEQQGVEMARLATERATRQDVRDLAAAVEATQTDEITTIEKLLRDWNQPTAADPDPHAHADHGGMHATDPERIAELRRTPAGPDFDAKFLNLLTGHQHGAVEMARLESQDGKHPDAKDLADRVVKSRTGQIQQMLGYLEQ